MILPSLRWMTGLNFFIYNSTISISFLSPLRWFLLLLKATKPLPPLPINEGTISRYQMVVSSFSYLGMSHCLQRTYGTKCFLLRKFKVKFKVYINRNNPLIDWLCYVENHSHSRELKEVVEAIRRCREFQNFKQMVASKLKSIDCVLKRQRREEIVISHDTWS